MGRNTVFTQLSSRPTMFPFRRSDDAFIPPEGYVIDKRYEVRSRIGEGGYGFVVRATQLSLGRPAAVKLLWPKSRKIAEKAASLQTEVRAIAAIDHPNIVTIYDFGEDKRLGPYVAMRLLRGESLDAMMDRVGPLDPHTIYRVMYGLCAALQAAHGTGIVHRDLKPQNVFLEASPDDPCGFRVKLLDFGVAYATGMAPSIVRESSNEMRGDYLQGTPATVSPEQVEGRLVEPRTDIYGLAATLFLMITAEMIFAAETVDEILDMHVAIPPRRLSELSGGRWVPRQLEELVDQMLAKEPEDRPVSVREVRQRLADMRNDVMQAWAERTHSPAPASGLDWAQPTAQAAGNPAVLAFAATQRGFEQTRVLVVDDEPAILDLMRLVLQRDGYAVDTAENGLEALARLRRGNAYEAMVVDLMMPGMDGAELIDQARGFGFDGPILLCSSMRSDRMRDDLQQGRDVTIVDKASAMHTLHAELRKHGISARRR